MVSNGHHEMEAAVRDEPARRPRSAEQDISGASADAIAAFTAMQEQARDESGNENVGDASNVWKRLVRRFGRKK